MVARPAARRRGARAQGARRAEAVHDASTAAPAAAPCTRWSRRRSASSAHSTSPGRHPRWRRSGWARRTSAPTSASATTAAWLGARPGRHRGAAAGLPAPSMSVYTDVRDLDGLAESCRARPGARLPRPRGDPPGPAAVIGAAFLRTDEEVRRRARGRSRPPSTGRRPATEPWPCPTAGSSTRRGQAVATGPPDPRRLRRGPRRPLPRRSSGPGEQVGLGGEDDDHREPLAGRQLDSVAEPVEQQQAHLEDDDPPEGDEGELGILQRRGIDPEERDEGDDADGERHRRRAGGPLLGGDRADEVEGGKREHGDDPDQPGRPGGRGLEQQKEVQRRHEASWRGGGVHS